MWWSWTRVAALLVLLGVALAASPARADCSPSDPFAEADRAPRVAVVRAAPAAAGPGASFRMLLYVEKVLKGPATPTSPTVSFNPLQGTSLQAGRRYLVFFEPGGGIVGGCATIDLGTAAGRAFPDAVSGWLNATDDRARTAHLVKTSVGGPFFPGGAPVAERALAHLAASPGLLVEVTAPERASLVDAVSKVVDERIYPLAWVLGRLHATESMPAWLAFLAVNHPSANHRPVQDALELMTNRHDPAYTPGRDFDLALGLDLRAGWARWHARNAGRSAQDFVDDGNRERGVPLFRLTELRSLEAAVRNPKDDLARRVALATCEQQLRTRTSLVPGSFATSTDWTRAAAVCMAPSAPGRSP